MQVVRGGRAALIKIEDDLKALDELVAQIDTLIPSGNLADIRSLIQNGRSILQGLSGFVNNELEPLLKRRDTVVNMAEIHILQERFNLVEARLHQLEKQQ